MKPTVRASVFAALLSICLVCMTYTPGTQAKGRTLSRGPVTQDDSPRSDQPEVVIEAPSTVKVGDMIVIDVSKSIGEGFDLIIRPQPPQVRVFNDGKVVVTATGPKTTEYLIIVSCALNGKSDVKVQVVRVIGPQPFKPVDPGENIAEKVLSWCETVNSPTPRDDALKLAQSFSSLATVINSNTFNAPIEIVAATKTSNRDALGSNLEYWVPLLDGLMNELKAMSSAGKLPDALSHGPVWRAVSEGLKAYAEKLAE